MKDNVLQKYLQPKPDHAPEVKGAPEDALDDLGSFGYLRGTHDRALMLELRHRDGKVTALSYAWLERAEFDPSEGITLHFGAKRVKVTGRNLNAEIRYNVRLFAGIARHRVPWIQEADEPAALQAPKSATVVEGLELK
ncbi:MAG TPA: hypothetical protein VGN12_25405 [Pirellulales bacterium]|jgi:hypothetical protein